MTRLITSAIAAIALSAGAGAGKQDSVVTVVVQRIRAISNFDKDILKKDRADFYAKVSIGGYWQKSPVWYGQDDARPSWAASETGMGKVVSIVIQVMDEDGAFEDKDDHADINPAESVKDIQIWYNTETGRIWGDVVGRKGEKLTSRGAGKDSDKAEIWFMVS